MPIYEYRALKSASELPGSEPAEVVGIIDADTERDARMRLRTSGVYVTELALVRPEKRAPFTSLRLAIAPRHAEDLAVLTRQFSTLVGAGIPLVDVLTVMIDQAGRKEVQIVLRDVREKVIEGSSLADALALHPNYFSELYVNMVRAGEASGRLASIFESLAAYSDRSAMLRGRVSAALIYPAIMVVVSIAVVVFLVTFVVPKFTGLLRQAHKALPLATVILVGLSNFIRDKFWVILLVLVGACILWNFLQKFEKFRSWLDRMTLRLPVIGQLVRKQLICHFSTTFATLLASGIRVSEGLVITKRVVANRVFRDAIEELNSEIRAGGDIASTLKKGGLFPPVVGYMIAVGEKSGRLEEMLRMISASYEQEIAVSLQKLIAVLEPAIVVVMAGVVAFIVIAILLPILTLSQVTF